jgi:Sulfatase
LTQELGTERAGPARQSVRRPGVGRELAFAWLHLTVLWAFAVARPLFAVLEDSPEFFVARGNGGLDIVVLALGVTLVPPTLLLLLEAFLIPWPRARRALHMVLVSVLLAIVTLQLLEELGIGSALLLIGLSLGLGLAGGFAYAKTRFVPAVLSVLALAPVLFVLNFLFISPVSDLILDGAAEGVTAANVRTTTPVVVVLFDEFSGASLTGRDGRIDASRYPNLARLARTSTWYRNATTVADETPEAVPALLSGRRPQGDQLPVAADHPENLFTLLGDRYRLNVSEPATDLCPERLCGSEEKRSVRSRLRDLFDDLSVVSAYLVLPAALEDRLPAVDQTFAGFRDGGGDATAAADMPAGGLENRSGQFDRFLSALGRPSDRPRLDFIHIALPHSPWEYLPSGQTYPVSGPDIPGVSGDEWTTDAELPTQAYRRYLLQLGFADREIGRLLDRLRAIGRLERSLVVVAADHGIGFRAGRGRRAADGGSVAEIANVPLFVKEPGQHVGRVDDGPARTIDLLPTIAKSLGSRLAGEIDGRPLPIDGGPDEQIEVRTFSGEDVTISFGELVRRRDRELRRRILLLGADDGFAGVYAPPAGGELIGRPVADLRPSPRAPFEVEFDFREGFAAFTPGSAGVPAFITGALSGSAHGGEEVAVAVNGRVAGVTRAYRTGGEVRMGVLVLPDVFREGANRVEAFALSEAGGDARLASAGRAQTEAARVRRVDGEEALVGVGGGEVPVEEGVADGYVDSVKADGNSVSVAGWATDAAHGQAAERVLLFSGDRLIQAATPTGPREDLAAQFGPGVALAGFEFTGVDADPGGRGPGRLRVFAMVAGRASELRGGLQ